MPGCGCFIGASILLLVAAAIVAVFVIGGSILFFLIIPICLVIGFFVVRWLFDLFWQVNNCASQQV